MTSPERSASSPRWSPDGRYLAFLAAADEGQKSQVWTLFLQGGEAVKRTAVTQGVSGYEWAPDSRRFVLVIEDPTAEEAKRAAEGKEAAKDEEEKAAPPWVITRRQFKRDYVGYLDNRRDASLRLRARDEGTHADHAWRLRRQRARMVAGRPLTWHSRSNRTDDPDSNEDTDIWRASGRRAERATGPRGQLEGCGQRACLESRRTVDCLRIRCGHGGAGLRDARISRSRARNGRRGETVDAVARSSRLCAAVVASDGRSIVLHSSRMEREHYLARVDARDGPAWNASSMARVANGLCDLDSDGTIAALVERSAQHPARCSSWAHGSTQRTYVNDCRAERALTLSAQDADRLSERRRHRASRASHHAAAAMRPGSAIRRSSTSMAARLSQYDYWRSSSTTQLLATANGYVVLHAEPRAALRAAARALRMRSGSRGARSDYEDVIAAVDYAIGAGYTDPDRLGVEGWSYGGMLTDSRITRTDRFKAAISWRGRVALHRELRTRRVSVLVGERAWPAVEEPQALGGSLARSTASSIVVTPTLLMGGDQDWNVPIINSEQLYLALKRLGVPTELVVYPRPVPPD